MFIISTDTSCDKPRGYLDEMQVPWLPLTFTIDGRTHDDDFTSDGQYRDFYERIREGVLPSTSQISAFLHEEFFDHILESQSGDIVHLPLSDGLSATHKSACAAAEESMRKHPGRKIYVVNTLSATQGHARILDEALMLRGNGETAEKAAAALNDLAARIHHWIIVDDLMHLKRGGRVSGAAAAIGTLLNLKPVLIINDAGKLAVVHKAKGTVKAMKYVIDRMREYGDGIDSQTVYLASADAQDKADAMTALIKENFAAKVQTGWIGPVIGSHTGCGTLGIVFVAKHRLSNT